MNRWGGLGGSTLFGASSMRIGLSSAVANAGGRSGIGRVVVATYLASDPPDSGPILR